MQVAHRIGAEDFAGARKILRQSVRWLVAWVRMQRLPSDWFQPRHGCSGDCVPPLQRDFLSKWHTGLGPEILQERKNTPPIGYGYTCFQFFVVGISISGVLPGWLGGDEMIRSDSSFYFRIFSLFLPALQLNILAGGMLRCSGNMRVPSMLNVLMCFWDVVFNFFLIFPTRQVDWWGWEFIVPGVGLGVEGAVLGTVLAELITAGGMMWYLCRRSSMLRLSGGQGSFLPRKETLRQAVRISLPMGFEHIAICGAQIMTTVIVAPLGIVAIAANSFAIIAESLCYMPGYGISEAATTLVGQSLGANRIRLLKRFANITVWSGMLIMGVMGVLMYVAAPQIIGVMTPVEEIRMLGIGILRIEAFAEPMFAASIVAYGVFVGAGNTFVPSLMNFGSIWGVRLTLAAWLAPTMGLRGVWLAMCIELCFRGAIFLVRLWSGNWIYKLRIKR